MITTMIDPRYNVALLALCFCGLQTNTPEEAEHRLIDWSPTNVVTEGKTRLEKEKLKIVAYIQTQVVAGLKEREKSNFSLPKIKYIFFRFAPSTNLHLSTFWRHFSLKLSTCISYSNLLLATHNSLFVWDQNLPYIAIIIRISILPALPWPASSFGASVLSRRTMRWRRTAEKKRTQNRKADSMKWENRKLE